MKRILSCTLSLALLLTLFAVPAYAAGEFTDVADDAYYADAVTWAVENKIAAGTGDNKFSPDLTCTKAQIIAFIWRAYGSEEAGDTRMENDNPFPDLDGTEYYFEAAKWAFTHGLVVGSLPFNGDEPCKRSTVMSYMWKAAEEPEPTTQNTFTDLIPALHNVNAISWAVEKGIAYGTSDTTFSPDDTCTRAQIISFLYRNLAKPVDNSSQQSQQSQQQHTGTVWDQAFYDTLNDNQKALYESYDDYGREMMKTNMEIARQWEREGYTSTDGYHSTGEQMEESWKNVTVG